MSGSTYGSAGAVDEGLQKKQAYLACPLWCPAGSTPALLTSCKAKKIKKCPVDVVLCRSYQNRFGGNKNPKPNSKEQYNKRTERGTL